MYTYRVSIALLELIFSNFWKTRWQPLPIFSKYCSTNYSNGVQAIVSRFDMQVSNHNIFASFWFLERSNWNKMAALRELGKFCLLSILTTSDQLKEKLWIYHHQTFYMDIRWHKLDWYWFAAIYEKQDGHHRQFSKNIVGPITSMLFKLSSPDLTCRQYDMMALGFYLEKWILWGFIHWFISISSCYHAGGQLCGCGQPTLNLKDLCLEFWKLYCKPNGIFYLSTCRLLNHVMVNLIIFSWLEFSYRIY